jgi:hypothetical protein
MKVLYIARYSIILFVILCTSLTVQSFPDYGTLYTTPCYLEESENKRKQNKEYSRAKSWTRPFNAMCGIAAPRYIYDLKCAVA